MKIVIDIDDKVYGLLRYFEKSLGLNDKKDDSDDVKTALMRAVINGTPLTPEVLADALMEQRIRGRLDSDTTFEKDVIRDVKCRLTVSIRDHRPCHCGVELREVWRESEDKE